MESQTERDSARGEGEEREGDVGANNKGSRGIQSWIL